MRGAVMYAPGDVRVDERPDPRLLQPTDAIIRLSGTCICGSICGPTGASKPSRDHRRWAMNTPGS